MKALLILALLLGIQKPFKCPNHPIKIGYVYEEIDLSYNQRRMMEYYIVSKVDSVNYKVKVIADSKLLYTDTLHKDYFYCMAPIQLDK